MCLEYPLIGDRVLERLEDKRDQPEAEGLFRQAVDRVAVAQPGVARSAADESPDLILEEVEPKRCKRSCAWWLSFTLRFAFLLSGTPTARCALTDRVSVRRDQPAGRFVTTVRTAVSLPVR